MKVQTDNYIYPPRPAEAIPRDQTDFLGQMGWLAQLKYNDSRCLVKYLPDGNIQLWNRHGERFRNYHCPDWLTEQLEQVAHELDLAEGGLHLLDGGLLDAKHRAIKDTIVIWDILVKDGEHLLGTTYQERYDQIAQKADIPWWWVQENKNYKLGLTWDKELTNIFIPELWPHQTWPSLWDMITEINAPYENICGPLIEGLVFKDPQGTLGMGYKEKNNSEWIMRSRVKTGRHLF